MQRIFSCQSFRESQTTEGVDVSGNLQSADRAAGSWFFIF